MQKIVISLVMALASCLCFAQDPTPAPNGAVPENPTTADGFPPEVPTNGGSSAGGGARARGTNFKQGLLIGTMALIAVGAAAALGGGSDTAPNH